MAKIDFTVGYPWDDMKVKLDPDEPKFINLSNSTRVTPSTTVTASTCNVDHLKVNGEDINEVIQNMINKYDSDRIFSDEILAKLLKDNVEQLRKELEDEFEKSIVKAKKNAIDDFVGKIKKVYFGGGWTVVAWEDGTVTRVKCQEGETFDKEKGVAMCIIKYMFGNINYYNEIFKSLNLDEDQKEVKPVVKKKAPKKKILSIKDIFGI